MLFRLFSLVIMVLTTLPARRILLIVLLYLNSNFPVTGENRNVLGPRINLGAVFHANLPLSYPDHSFISSSPQDGLPLRHIVQNGPVTYRVSSARGNFHFGPIVEFYVSRKLSLQSHIIYSDLGDEVQLTFDPDHSSLPSSGILSTRFTNKGLEIPVLLKYTFGNSSVQPFIGAGPAFRFNLLGSYYGVSVISGFNLSIGYLTVAPQVHYSQLINDSYLPQHENRISLVVGILVR